MSDPKGPDSEFVIIRPPRYESEAEQAVIDAGEADLLAGFKRAGTDNRPASYADKGELYDDQYLPAALSDPVSKESEGASPTDPSAPATPLSGFRSRPLQALGDTWQDPLRRKLERPILMMVPYTAAGQVAVPRRPYNQNATFIGAGNIAFELSYDPSFPAGSTAILPGDRNVCFLVPVGTEVWMRSSVVVGTLSVVIEPFTGEC